MTERAGGPGQKGDEGGEGGWGWGANGGFERTAKTN